MTEQTELHHGVESDAILKDLLARRGQDAAGQVLAYALLRRAGFLITFLTNALKDGEAKVAEDIVSQLQGDLSMCVQRLICKRGEIGEEAFHVIAKDATNLLDAMWRDMDMHYMVGLTARDYPSDSPDAPRKDSAIIVPQGFTAH